MAWDIEEIDITDRLATLELLRAERPDLIVNSAVYVDLEGCESNPDKAWRINAVGAQNLALAAQQLNSGLVYISTHYIFDGQTETDYDEVANPNPLNQYGRSKLANILFTYELARRLKGTHVTANALHPGLVGTNIFKTDFSIFGGPFKWFMERISLTPEQGADNTVYLATSRDVEGISGKYFVKREAVSSSSLSYDEELARRLWEKSEKVTGLS